MSKKNILFIGAPGSGKGTQSSYIIADYGVVQISTGDILRAAVKAGTELGKLAKRYMDEGKLVPDEVIIGVMKERLQEPDTKNGVIFDGFPRTVPQAVALDDMLKELDMQLTHVVSLEVADELIYERITGRRSCPTCGKVYHTKFNPPLVEGKCDDDKAELVQRSDDTEETLSKRLKVYHDSTAILKPYYEKRGNLLVVNGTGKPEEIYKKIKSFLG
jgi:adenylate kinase